MVKNIAINGFGRIGRCILRILLQNNDFNVVLINNPSTNIEQLCTMLLFDSKYGQFNENIIQNVDSIKIKDSQIFLSRCRDIKDIPFEFFNVNYVIDCTGKFKTVEDTKDYNVDIIKKVVITSPSPDLPMYIFGVNMDKYENEKIVSNASCTTNCVAPMLKILDDNYKINKVSMTTIHSVTSSQYVVDKFNEKDMRLGRSALNNIIPTTTGAKNALIKILPDLKDKLIASSIRVPTLGGSLVEINVELNKSTSLEEINTLIKKYDWDKILGENVVKYSSFPIVSSDIVGTKYSCIYDSLACDQLDNHTFKLLVWYDNEWGYSNRVVDLMKFISQ